MRNELVFAGLALVLAAGAASASGVTPGRQQLANQLGVDAAAYSAAELTQLQGARRDNDKAAYDVLLSHGTVRGKDTTSVGKAQIAAQIGVDPAEFTTAELIQLTEAKRSGDLQAVTFYLKHENRNDYYFPQPEHGSDN
ncbi:hypothetical protein FBT96_17405 [Rhodobacter capsulatus]|uniref:DUF1318 domain-containing protein n=1 Tax=Rhodobacter capsulatus TaxID=1061 RepID=A0A4V5PPJ5_RHOCA|nr:hypothetical protein [Rhodobacter capsulatus]TKD14673.1 hypothetical protein FBT96_17405 [Rhodobacter capsulatus]